MSSAPSALIVDIEDQYCYVLNQDRACIQAYPVSTASRGVGQQYGSEQTPLGKHRIVVHAGIGAPKNTVFIARMPQKHRYGPSAHRHYPGREDWILSRVFWLAGCEGGYNAGGNCDSQRRKIYFHGTPDHVAFDQPSSHGCIRMRNDDIIALSAHVFIGMSVEIVQASSYSRPSK